MTSIQKMAIVAVAIIALILMFSTSGSFGVTTNYDDLDVDTLTVGTSAATSSSNLGRACITMTTSNGNTVYWYASATGSLATSSVSCN